MKYTFLLPAFKGAFLREALESIQRQTYADFSVLISDDDSPDNLLEIVRPFLSDPRFSYRKNKSNIGANNLVTHWNLLLSMCHSPYLIMAGDDDIYEADYLSFIDQLVCKYPDVNLLRGRMDKIDENGQVKEIENSFESHQTMPYFVSDLFDPCHLHAIGQYTFKTSELRDAGGFVDFPLAWFSDDATAVIASKNGVAHTEKVLFHARNSGINISSNNGNMLLRNKATIGFHRWFISLLHNYTDDSGIWRQAEKNCESYCRDRLMNYYTALPCDERFSTLREFPSFIWSLIKNRLSIWLGRSAN